MKKILLATVAAFAVLSACQKNEIQEPWSAGVLHAQIEQMNETKTSMDAQRNIRWSERDQVIAFMKSTLGSKYQVSSSSIGKTSADFEEISSGNGGLHSGNAIPHNVVYYPYASSIECSTSDGNYNLSVVLPSEQIYVPSSFGNGSFPMVAVSQKNEITFRNIIGGIKLQLKGTQKITSIKLEGKNHEKLSGPATIIAYHEDTKPSIVMLPESSATVSLDCEEGVQLNENTTTDFIIALPPVEFSKGFTTLITDNKGNGYIIETDKANTIYRSSILVMPAIALGEPDIPIWEDLPDYVDEYGINHGSGININDVVWAPVNCGYHIDDYKWGKLYQWGRKYGQGYSGSLYDINRNEIGEISDATIPSVEKGPVALDYGQSEENANVIFSGNYNNDYNWLSPLNENLWNDGTESDPLKTQYDPCPYGWRVPTYTELKDLFENHSDWTTNDTGQNGRWFSGTTSYSIKVPQVFLTAAGFSSEYDISEGRYRGYDGFYWSSNSRYGYFCRLAIGGNEIYSSSGNSCHSIRCVYDPYSDNTSGITLSTNALTLYEGDIEQLTAKIRPDYPNLNTVTWSSDNPSVATVDQTGSVTAISAGKANITAASGGIPAVCTITVFPFAGASNYVDEYGIAHGKGIAIGNTIWAPVNCGYHKEDYPYGKLYQWGRRYGQGYSDEYDTTVPIFAEGGVELEDGQSLSNANVFFYGLEETGDWLNTKNNKLWNNYSKKAEYDPCPDGWRVPTYDELSELRRNYSKWTIEKYHSGHWFSGSEKYSEDVPQIFLPAAGSRNVNGESYGRNSTGYYWSARLEQGNYGYSSYLLTFGSLVNMDHHSCSNGMSVRCVQE